MWTMVVLAVCAVCPVQSIILSQDIGATHIHKKAKNPLKAEYFPLSPADVHATKTAESYIKNILPKLDGHVVRSRKNIILPELGTEFTLNLQDITIKGFRKATLNGLVVRTANSRVDFNVSIPLLSIIADIIINGTTKNHAILSADFGLSMFMDEVKIAGAFDLEMLRLPSKQNVFQIRDADIKVDIKEIMADFEMIKDPDSFKMNFADFMNNPFDDIVTSVSRVIIKLINERLAKIPGKYILDYLVPPAPSVQTRFSYLRNPYYRYPGYYY